MKLKNHRHRREFRMKLKRDIDNITDYFERATSIDPNERRKTIQEDINNTSRAPNVMVLVKSFESDRQVSQNTIITRPKKRTINNLSLMNIVKAKSKEMKR
jgi:RIO-like serine/threonine protein kinase